MMNGINPRAQALKLGYGSMGISTLMTIAPRVFARLYGLKLGDGTKGVLSLKAAGARDAAVNYGLIKAAKTGDGYAPWLLARTICDAGDVAGVVQAIVTRNAGRGVIFFGLVATVHTAIDIMTLRLARQEQSQQEQEKQYSYV